MFVIRGYHAGLDVANGRAKLDRGIALIRRLELDLSDMTTK